MNKWIASLLLLLATTTVHAGVELKNIPDLLQTSLRNNSVKAAIMDGTVLRVELDKPTVSELVYSSFIVHAICAEQWRKPEKFSKLDLTRVEVLDAAGTQGFAFDGNAAACAEMGGLGVNFGVFIGKRTVKCDAGTCAKRH